MMLVNILLYDLHKTNVGFHMMEPKEKQLLAAMRLTSCVTKVTGLPGKKRRQLYKRIIISQDV